jgi:ribosome biogenesis GTPase
MNGLEQYGWNDERAHEWAALSDPHFMPARVVADHGHHYKVATPSLLSARTTGAIMHTSTVTDMPKIGDWVSIEQIDNDSAIIHSVLPRSSELVRGHVGRQIDKQVIAANVDIAFVVQPLNHDFSPARLERYIFQLSTQNIKPIIIFNKTDLVNDIDPYIAQLKSIEANIIPVSARHDNDISLIHDHIMPYQTVVILGSSGAGKSTLTNRLVGNNIQATAPIREKDSKGRHTTVHRELFVLPNGGMVIDTPGVRELQLWGNEADLEQQFPEIFTAARACRYSNCEHESEDGCMIKAGLKNGTIDPKRYSLYQQFSRELQSINERREFISTRKSDQSRESSLRRMKRRRIREQEKGSHYE